MKVTIQVPATTANLGPGYDCLGVALTIYNRVTVERAPAGLETSVMASDIAAAFFEAAGCAPFPFAWEITGDVPRSRGLGSSVTVRLGLLHGLNRLAGDLLTPQRLFEICAQQEGHPDNAAPAALGGFVICGREGQMRFEVEEQLHFVLLVPPFEISTPQARSVLPPQLDRLEAVRSCANACRIAAAFASGQYEALRGAFGDGLHQPFRRQLIPFLDDVISAGEAAGALGGFLSGSGSAICCVAQERPGEIAAAMLQACGEANAYTLQARADNRGAVILR